MENDYVRLQCKRKLFQDYWVAHQIERNIGNQSGTVSRQLWESSSRNCSSVSFGDWYRSGLDCTSVPKVCHSSRDSSSGKAVRLSWMSSRDRKRVGHCDWHKGIDLFCKEKTERCYFKHTGSIPGRQRLTSSHITLAGNDFSWSEAFPVNQVLMMSEV